MDIIKLQRVIIDGLEDVKAQDIKVFNTSHLTSLFDRVIVASGTSNRQTKALASSVRESVKEAGGHVISVEGEDVGEWVLVDCGDAVVHIMQPALRQYYNLEEIWGDKPVKVKLSTQSTFGGARVTIDEDEDEASSAPARKAAARKTAGKKTTATKAAGTKTARTKSTGAKTAGAKTTVSRTTGTKSTGTSTYSAKTPARTGTKAAAGVAPAKKAPARKSAAGAAAKTGAPRKTAARKTPRSAG
ncbi:ribosome silencing factor [Pararobbsia alpina]|uniref:Ribosomal silencing factor RsfS n=1 Tax=Pararobbsia alpina TaxID=621374 RepID=A0A6S7BFQ5_9BURK|nr:ribosome silencing factor [Pararobbsia alpina]CAB3786829.1 Ribosomal silencing factor RsfS [Pararobbsia alpina]